MEFKLIYSKEGRCTAGGCEFNATGENLLGFFNLGNFTIQENNIYQTIYENDDREALVSLLDGFVESAQEAFKQPKEDCILDTRIPIPKLAMQLSGSKLMLTKKLPPPLYINGLGYFDVDENKLAVIVAVLHRNTTSLMLIQDDNELHALLTECFNKNIPTEKWLDFKTVE